MKRTPSLGATIFDLDGTLVDSRLDLVTSVNFALQAVGLPERSESEIFEFIGFGARQLVGCAVAPHHELLEPALEVWRKHYSEHLVDRTRPYLGVPELLERLPGALAVHTGKSGTLARLMLEKLGLAARFAAIVGAEDVAQSKPDPAGAQWILDRLGVSPERAAYVGDSAIDLATARAAGIRFVGVAWGIRAEELHGTGADVARDPEDLEQILASHTTRF